MNKQSLYLIAVIASLFTSAVGRAQYCDFPPNALVRGSRREYKGRYENGAYRYSVVIPDRLVGYDVVNPFYQHGFGLILGKKPYSYLSVDGSPNSLEFATPFDAARSSLELLSEQAKVTSSQTSPMQIDGQSGVLLVTTYTCPRSTDAFVMSSAILLSGNRSMVYQMTLYALAERYDRDRSVLNDIIKSWRYKPR